MKTTLTAALLLAAGLAAAQEPAPATQAAPEANAAPQKAGTKKGMKAITTKRQSVENMLDALAAQRDALIAAVKADKTNTPDQKKAAIADIRTEVGARREAIFKGSGMKPEEVERMGEERRARRKLQRGERKAP